MRSKISFGEIFSMKFMVDNRLYLMCAKSATLWIEMVLTSLTFRSTAMLSPKQIYLMPITYYKKLGLSVVIGRNAICIAMMNIAIRLLRQRTTTLTGLAMYCPPILGSVTN